MTAKFFVQPAVTHRGFSLFSNRIRIDFRIRGIFVSAEHWRILRIVCCVNVAFFVIVFSDFLRVLSFWFVFFFRDYWFTYIRLFVF